MVNKFDRYIRRIEYKMKKRGIKNKAKEKKKRF